LTATLPGCIAEVACAASHPAAQTAS